MFNSQYNPDLEADIRQQLLDKMENDRISPADQDTLPNGIPGEHVSNVTPWLDKIGLWKANDGSDPNWKPKTPLEFPEEEEEEEEEELTEEEIDAIVQGLLEEGDENPEGEDEVKVDSETEEAPEPNDDGEELTEEEIQNLVSELMDSEEE